jgi:hypothetical protein
VGVKRRRGKLVRTSTLPCGCTVARFAVVRFVLGDDNLHAATSGSVPVHCPECRKPTRILRTRIRPA